MRPVLKLMGRGEIHAADSLAEVKLTRKTWYVLALLATAPDTEMLRLELTEIAWPLSDDRSRDVLLHKWRKSVVDAFAELGAQPVVVISERVVKLDTTLIKIDYLECLRIGNVILNSLSAAETLQAALEFDDLATDQDLIAGHPEAFETQRAEFNALRIQCLERGWRAAITCGDDTSAERFSDRLRALGFTGTLIAEPETDEFVLRKGSKPRDFSRGIAAALLVGLISAPVILGKLSQPPPARRMSGNLIPDQAPTYIGRFIQYEYKPKPEDNVTLSEAVASVQVPGGGAVTTGVVRYKNMEQQILTVRTSRNRKLLWSTLTPRANGIQYFPEHIVTDKFGNIFVGAHIQILKSNAIGKRPGMYPALIKYGSDGKIISSSIARTAENNETHRIVSIDQVQPVKPAPDGPRPGRYLALLKYSPEGKLLSTSISDKPEDKILHLIRVVSDMQGGAWLFTTGKSGASSVTIRAMHLKPSGELNDEVTVSKRIAQLTSVTQGAKGENYLVSTVYNRNTAGNTSDWQVQRLSKDGKLEWTRTIDGPAHKNDFFSDGALATNGDFLVYGPLATTTLDGVVRNIPSVVRLDPGNGRIKKLEQTQTHFLNTRVMLSPVPMLDMYVLGSYDMAQEGSNSVYFYRSRPSDDFSSLSMIVGLPKKMKAKRIVSMYYRGSIASFSALLQPLESPGQRLALIYVNKYSGTDITTGILTTDKPVHYNQSDANIVAGRFGKNYTIFDFTGLK